MSLTKQGIDEDEEVCGRDALFDLGCAEFRDLQGLMSSKPYQFRSVVPKTGHPS